MNLNFRTISPAIYLYGMLVGFMLISCPNQVPASNIYSIAKEAEAEFQSGRYKSALEKFQKALSLNRDYLPAILGLGKTYSRLGSFKRAVEALQLALRLEIQKEQVLSEMGNTYLEAGMTEQAMKAFESARKAHVGYFPAEIGMARLFRLRGQLSQSAELISRLEKRFPMRYEIYIEKFHLAMTYGDLNNAENALTRAEGIKPNAIEVELLWAKLLAEKFFLATEKGLMKDFLLDQSLEKIDQALNLHGQHQDALAMKARLLILQKKWTDAEMVLDALLDKKVDYYLYYFLAGFVAEKNGKINKALNFYAQALEKNDENSVLNIHVENFLISGNFALNQELRRRLSDYRFQNAEMYFKKNLSESAMHELSRSLLLDPNRLKAHEKLLEIYKLQGLTENYIAQLKKILDILSIEEFRLQSKYQFLLEKAIRQRREHLYYRENLQYPFQQKSISIQLKMVDITPSSVVHPSTASDIKKVLAQSFYFHPRFKNFTAEDHGQEPDFVLEISVREGINQLHLFFALKHYATGVVLNKFTFEDLARGALDRLSIRTLKYLDLLIPPLGKIIKIKPDYLLVNLGKPDNVKTGSSINFYRISRSTFFYDQEKNKVYLITKGKVTEVDGLISKVMLEKNQDYAKLRLDDLASSKDEEIEKKAGKVKN